VKNNLEKGCIYVATGTRCLEEAIRSASSFKAVMPEVSVWLWSDADPQRGDLFDRVVRIDKPARSFEDKIRPLLESPFKKTIFLDSDTYVCAPLHDVYEILDRFDFAAAHPLLRTTMQQDLPDAFPEVNSGVMAFCANEKVREMIVNWLGLYDEHVKKTGRLDDQPPLRVALYKSDLQIAILPPEYNVRTIYPGAIGRGRVKVLHGKQKNLQEVAKRLNKSLSPRVFFTRLREFLPRHCVFLDGPSRLFGAFVFLFGWMALLSGKLVDGFRHWLKLSSDS